MAPALAAGIALLALPAVVVANAIASRIAASHGHHADAHSAMVRTSVRCCAAARNRECE